MPWIENQNGCWIWQGQHDVHGYGRFRASAKSKWTMAHRDAYSQKYGPIPNGLCVCHKCDVRDCVNPDHLFLGTHLDNVRDMWAKGRGHNGNLPQLQPKEFCKRGHLLSKENRLAPRFNTCKQCHAMRVNLAYHKKKGNPKRSKYYALDYFQATQII